MDPIRPDPLLRHGWRSYAILGVAWLLPALMVAALVYAIQAGAEGSESLGTILLRSLWFYGQLAVLCPLVYRLQQHLSFSPGRWPIACLAYGVLAVGVVVALTALSGVANWVLDQGETTLAEFVRLEFTTPPGQFQAVVYLFYFALIVAAMMIVGLRRQSRRQGEQAAELALQASRLEAQVALARLKALESQLNPHFLFNALNGVASLVQLGRSDQAYEAIALLGELLRESLHEGDRHSISLEREVELLEKYLDLERIRFSDRLRVSVAVDAACSSAVVPAMVLQPLVENALRHGISEHPDAGQLQIEVRRHGPRVVVAVQDDGPGVPAGWSFDADAGVGLRNLRDRLAVHYGSVFELTLASARPRGTLVTLAFPYRTLAGGAAP